MSKGLTAHVYEKYATAYFRACLSFHSLIKRGETIEIPLKPLKQPTICQHTISLHHHCVDFFFLTNGQLILLPGSLLSSLICTQNFIQILHRSTIQTRWDSHLQDEYEATVRIAEEIVQFC